MGAIAVVDIGKTTAKLLLVDRASGETRTLASAPNAVRPGRPYPHADTEALWRFIVAGLGAAAAAGSVDGIAVTTHGATAALVAGAELALPVLDYEHPGPDTARDYDRLRPEFAETLSPRLPAGLNLGAQLHWLATAHPDDFARAETILLYPQYWAWRLSGVAASEVTSLGCHTDLWAPAHGRFSSLVARAGWAWLFPPMRPAASVLGPIRPEIAAATGLDPATPVACGIHDSNASLLPWLSRRAAPFTIVSSGTWTIVMTVGGPLDALDPARDTLANVDAFGRPVPTARFMGGREYALLVGDTPEPADLGSVARVIDAQVFALPSFVAGVGPFGSGRGRWSGDAGSLAPRERTAAADLYLALTTRACLSLVGTGRQVVVEGPLARNPSFLGLFAALTPAPVLASPDATGTALGAAMLLAAELAPPADPALVAPADLPGLEAYADRWRALAGA
jgi:sugar (pentulose or hexulose) kinase